MPNGFQTWKVIIEAIVIPIVLALIAYFYSEIQNANHRRRFIELIIRELQELSPSYRHLDGVKNGGNIT